MTIGGLPEFRDIISVQVQDKRLNVPKYAKVNGIFQSSYYDIQEGDDIEVLDYCTVGQLLEFMDVLVPEDQEILVNHKPADRETRVYENYLVSFQMKKPQEKFEGEEPAGEEVKSQSPEAINPEAEGMGTDISEMDGENGSEQVSSNAEKKARPNHSFTVQVNGKPVLLTGKPEYVYVDVFDRIDFDLSKPQGKGVVTKLNGRDAQYMEPLLENDVLEIYWEKDE